jgi:hypothetical protein
VKKLLALIAAAICATVFVVAAAQAEVFPQSPYHKTVGSSGYDGSCTTNFVNGGLINSCQAELTSGPPVPNSIVVSGTCRTVFVVTQNGNSGRLTEVCKT